MAPPTAAWDERRERRWSGEMFKDGNRPGGGNGNGNGLGMQQQQAAGRRNSGAMMPGEKRRLRFSDGQPEIYNEQGLVGRAL